MRRRCAVPPDSTVLAVTRAIAAIDHRPVLGTRLHAVLAQVVVRSPVALHGAGFFVDHWRAIVTARDGYVLADFLRRANRRLARVIIAHGLDGWAAPIWHRRSELTILRDPAARTAAMGTLFDRKRPGLVPSLLLETDVPTDSPRPAG